MSEEGRRTVRLEAYLHLALDLWNASGETTVCTLEGSCMVPLLREGDRLTIRHGEAALRRGDIAVFRSAEGILVNRVLGSRGEGDSLRYTLKADRSSRFRRDVPGREILGRVVGIETAEGYRDLDSRRERWLGRYLALRSYVVGRASSSGTLPWRGVRRLIELRARLLPTDWSLSMLPYRMMRGAGGESPPSPSPATHREKEVRENE